MFITRILAVALVTATLMFSHQANAMKQPLFVATEKTVDGDEFTTIFFPFKDLEDQLKKHHQAFMTSFGENVTKKTKTYVNIKGVINDPRNPRVVMVVTFNAQFAGAAERAINSILKTNAENIRAAFNETVAAFSRTDGSSSHRSQALSVKRQLSLLYFLDCCATPRCMQQLFSIVALDDERVQKSIVIALNAMFQQQFDQQNRPLFVFESLCNDPEIGPMLKVKMEAQPFETEKQDQQHSQAFFKRYAEQINHALAAVLVSYAQRQLDATVTREDLLADNVMVTTNPTTRAVSIDKKIDRTPPMAAAAEEISHNAADDDDDEELATPAPVNRPQHSSRVSPMPTLAEVRTFRRTHSSSPQALADQLSQLVQK